MTENASSPSPEGNADRKRSGEALCLACGLCCTGAIFDRVVLRGEAEKARMQALGLRTQPDRLAFALPCSAHKDGRCTIYPGRPLSCRQFRCKLLNKVTDAEVSLQQATDMVEQAHALRDRLAAAATAFDEAAATKSIHVLEHEFLERFAAAASERERQQYGQVLLYVLELSKAVSDHFWNEPGEMGD